MKWILKAIVQKVISYFPNSQKVNFLFQKYITKGVQLSDQYFSDKYNSAIDHLYYFKKHGKTDSFRVLELGSGWYPVVPIALFLAGSKSIVSFDISPLMNKEGILKTIQKFLDWEKKGMLNELKPYAKQERFIALEKLNDDSLTFEELLSGIALQLKVKDARDTGEKADSFDLICSNNTFEHIYPIILKPIIAEFQKLLIPGGVMSHFIDMSDHFAHLDKSISIYNFLKFSKTSWAIIDNSVQPQNRWRFKDYLDLYNKLEIPILDQKVRPGDLDVVKKMNLHSDFKNYSPAEVAISHGYIVSGKA
tara:strand:- start:1479 stop:2396 length:918 start_codon:yes stop_codon:yes gene_type:complete